MIVADLDLGSGSYQNLPFQTNRGPMPRQNYGHDLVYGDREIVWPTGGTATERTETVWVSAPTAIGANPKGSPEATQELLWQLFDLASNPAMNPTFIQWGSGGGVIATTRDDGWWLITKVDPDDEFVWSAAIPVTISAVKVVAGPLTRIGIGTDGGAAVSTYTGPALPWVAYPLGSTVLLPTSVSRVGAEGSIPLTLSPASLPAPLVISATLANLFKGGARVYDVMANIGTNPVPTDGTFVNPNWIEVKGKNHRFVGDVVITNGLHLYSLALGASSGVVSYLWNTALAGGAAWQSFASLFYQDNGAATGTLRQVSITRVGLDEVVAKLVAATANGQAAEIKVRLQRGAYHSRVDFRPLTQNVGTIFSLFLRFSAAPKVIYDSAAAVDGTINAGSVTPGADYGYGAAFLNSAGSPFVAGWLWQTPPSGQQPAFNGTTDIGITDTPAQNVTKSYGIFAIPFVTPQNLQAEGESGALGTGWSSVADALASGGNVAKCLSGTLVGNADLCGTAWQPPTGTGFLYDVWVRVKVTSAAGAVAEMTFGLWDATSSAYVASTTLRANQAGTGYGWVRVAQGVTPTAAHNMQFRAVTAGTLGTDWFWDEVALVPSSNGADWPRDQFQQFQSDRVSRVVVG